MALILCEEFVSIQGEGSKSGILSQFIRLAGCNLKCSFCDEPKHVDSKRFYKILPDELARKAINSQVGWVVLTGGEPTMQKDIVKVIKALQDYDIKVSVETNGYDLDLVNKADLITWSPKYNFEEAFLNNTEVEGAKKPELFVNTELDVKIPYPSKVPEEKLLSYIKFLGSFLYEVPNKCNVFLTPINNKLDVDRHNVQAAYNFIDSNRVVKFGNSTVHLNLNTQVHKFLGLR
ncbi:7-carboxy-7-deazaguanine synthase QueE [Campylobacter upsaliensis]|uniref:7-carboxy-7-deazaguanine synthase QueE n=1 Tax=Campylobacter upsaliensis TaxID=28080 RepID=UPI0012C888F3|nr:7-carboxy-7-deazaguanine synthase QueE [Campylobacter upsaliensis]EAK7296942.1 7-carboxy-7-deazaguanine synthase QueE [Campylobacter upsaliensis]MBJ6809621.1 7-carboxy-7-deazaguanine synthase QueE [Campylobacter upsaliensis]